MGCIVLQTVIILDSHVTAVAGALTTTGPRLVWRYTCWKPRYRTSVAVQYRNPNTPTLTKNSADEEKSPCRYVVFPVLLMHDGMTYGMAPNLEREERRGG